MTETSISAAQLASLVDSVKALLVVLASASPANQAEPVGEFLSRDELRELTGAARTAKQTEWLKGNGLPHRVDRSRVIISREHVRRWLEGRFTAISGDFNWGSVR